MKVLVSGFGPFPGVPHNVSSDIAEKCAKAWNARSDIVAEHITLPTQWNVAPEIMAKHIARAQPDIIIHLGVSERATNLTLETYAYNACSDMLDAAGLKPAMETLGTENTGAICSTAPVQKIADRLAASGHPFTQSSDPGRYLCNAVYHASLAGTAAVEHQPKILFVHIPTALGEQAITQEVALKGLNVVLDAMIEG